MESERYSNQLSEIIKMCWDAIMENNLVVSHDIIFQESVRILNTNSINASNYAKNYKTHDSGAVIGQNKAKKEQFKENYPISAGQIKFLKILGHKEDISKLTMKEASILINDLKSKKEGSNG